MKERLFTNNKTIDGYREPYLLVATVCDRPPGYTCLRKCPECGNTMVTNHRGKFWCQCGYRDYQDVSKLYESGLDYPFFYYDPVIYGRAKTSMRKDRVLT